MLTQLYISVNKSEIEKVQINKFSFFLILFFSILIQNIYTQDKHLRIQHYTTQEGLSQNAISSIYKDSRGYMWFGTLDGLNRFDGYNFIIYRPEKTKNSIISGTINEIKEDKDGNLWIATNRGLSKFIFNKEKFISFEHDLSNKNNLPENFTALTIDRYQNIWIGNVNGLVRKLILDSSLTKINRIVTYTTVTSGNNYTSNNLIKAFLEDHEGYIWIGSIWGLDKLNPKTGKLTNYSDPLHPLIPPAASIYSLYEDKNHFLWVGRDIGLACYNPQRLLIKSYSVESKCGLTHNVIQAINEDLKGNLLVGTLNGLHIFNRNSETFYRVPVNDNNYSLNNEFISKIYCDRSGNIWIGTEKGGINKYNIFQKQFMYFEKDPQNTNTLNHNLINSITDDDDYLWVGTAGGGLNKYNKATRKFSHYITNPLIPGSISSNFISMLLSNKEGGVWAATWGEGLNKVNVKNDSIQINKYQPNPNIPGTITNLYISSLVHDRQQNLWIGGSLGVEVFDAVNNKFYLIKTLKNGKEINGVASLLIDNNNRLWIGTINGIYMIKLKKNKTIEQLSQPDSVFFFYHDSNDPKSPSGSHIVTMYQDNTGSIWFSVLGNGIDKLEMLSSDGSKAIFTNYSTDNGLSNNVVYGILEDNHNNLWLSTDKGLTKFNYKKHIARSYFESDGLQSNQFYWAASFKNTQGTMFFGGTKGLNYFNPDNIKDDTIPIRIVINDFKIFNQPILIDSSGKGPLTQTISETKVIKLAYDQNMVSFEFTALSYNMPEKNLYAYQMTGIDKDWIHTDAKRRFATYTNLAPGNYTFRVKASNSDGIWNEKGTSINIIIFPPWWETVWFRLIIISCFILCLIFLLSTMIKKITHKANQTILDERNQLKTLINNIPDNIFIKDTRSRFLVVNDHAVKFMGGKNEKEFILKTDFEFYPKETAYQLFEQELNILRSGKPLLNEESTITKNNKTSILSTTKCPIINSKGETIGLIGIVRDITKQKLNEQKIIRQSEDLKSYNEKLNETNTTLEERQQQIEEQAEELSVQADNLREANGLLNDKQQLIQQQAEKLQEKNDQLTLLNATKDRFFSIIAHDLRNPFHLLIGFSELLLRNFEKYPVEKNRRYLQLILDSSNSGHNLLENLLQWSRTQTGHISYEPVAIKLSEIINETFNLLLGIAEQKHISLASSVDENLFVLADENMIKTIIRNLLTNAIKFTPAKGRITIKATMQQSMVEITVTDNGIGISKENLEKLFRIDTPVSTMGTENEKGTGLGLLLCKEFIENHGGKIRAESTEGKGSKFIFTLPVH